MKKRVLAIVLAVFLLAALLTACGGGSGSDSKYVGKYYMSRIADWSAKEYADLFDISEQEAKESMWVELKSGGKATFFTDDEAEEVSWRVSGETLTLTSQGEELSGTIKDGVITFNLDGDTLELTKG